jgi:Ca2+-binding EF-hand superfamily protein
MKVNTVLMTVAMAGAMTLGAAALEPPAWAAPSAALKALDPDKDGTVDLAEAKAAASILFDQLDPDKDGTLDRRELRGRLNAKDMAAGDPDKDGTIDKNEYLAIVEQRFKAADPDTDGTLDDKELKSSAGRSLLRLLIKYHF